MIDQYRNAQEKRPLIAGLAAALAALAASPALADGSRQSDEPVYWFFDIENPVGSAKLIRSPNGATAIFQTSGLPAGQAVTLWFIVFNNPDQCTETPCNVPMDLFTPGVDGDFHAGGGLVTGGSGNATFAGHLQVGDVSKSGRLELGLGGEAPLMDPYGAEIVLAVHSHGPKLQGVQLKEQISTFSGGCLNFLGPNGFASSLDDVPDADGECSTIQFSRHLP